MMEEKIIVFLTILGCVYSQMIFPDEHDKIGNPGLYFSEDRIERYSIKGDGNANNINRIMEDSYTENNIANGLNNFALNINQALLNKINEPIAENFALSPLSIVGALSLVLLGSVGKTYDELARALGFFNDISNSVTVHREFGYLLNQVTSKNAYSNSNDHTQNISYASGIFLQNDYPIRSQYNNVIKNVYGSDVLQVDFKNNAADAQTIINKWVYEKTNGKIKNIMTTIPPQQTRLVISSALYFMGEWEKYFFDGATQRSPFTPDKRYPERTILVDMMANEGNFLFYKSNEYDCMLLGLPYRGNKTILYAVKPIDSTRKSLKELLNEMTAEKLNYMIRNAKRQSTIVLFPKMKLSSTYNLKTILQAMGVNKLFSSTEANLALLSPKNFPTSNVYNKDEVDDKLIFTRIGLEPNEEEGCSEFFRSNDPSKDNCIMTEIIAGKNIKVMYKRIGDKVGRRIIKRSVINSEYVGTLDNEQKNSRLYNRHNRFKRQSLEYWNPGLYVDEVVHKVDMDITETGTEAAAATAVFVSRGGSRPVFTANEPFFFMIRDEDTGFPLFTSVVYKPIPNYV